MQKLISVFIFFILITSLLANPAPLSIEIEDVLLIILPCFLGLLSLHHTPNYVLQKNQYALLFAVLLYFTYLFISMLMAFIYGVPLLNILRGIGPYLNFFPLLLIGLLPKKQCDPWIIGCLFIAAGFLQSTYHLFLYITQPHAVTTSLSVLRNRITLLDPRTTLPLILSITSLPLVFLCKKNSSLFLKLLIVALIIFGLFGAIVTLTRSVLLSMAFGWLIFTSIYIYQQSYLKLFSALQFLKQLFLALSILMISMVLLSSIPRIQTLEQGLLARFSHASSSTKTADYSNGRLYDEWLPALNTWMNTNHLSILFGIGAGNTFTIATGEERTYVHNLFIYNLVYGGLFGMLVGLWLYLITFSTLVLRAVQTQQTIYLGFAALLASLFFYGQLFAVHKGLAYNAMLFLIIGIALHQPKKNISSITSLRSTRNVWD